MLGYSVDEPARVEVDALPGAAVVQFGSNTCGWCRAAQPVIAEAFAGHANVRHIKVEDGKGRPLGRSYRVKLWPTLIFLQDGQEVARVVRPRDAASIRDALDHINPAQA